MKTWFFDLDGTLADTDADIRASWKAALADIGLECPRFDELFIAGPPLNEMVKILFPEKDSPELVEQLRTGFARHYDHDGFPLTREYPGVLDAVRRIRASGASTILATNKRYEGTLAMVAHFGWGPLFDGVYAGDMHRNDPIGRMRKPELLKFIMSERGLDAADCVMVGDTKNDFEAAQKNGIFSIAVTWGYGTREEWTMANRTVSSPEEIDR